MQPMIYRQGNVFLIRQDAPIPADCRPVESERGRTILAHGELTGHHHSVDASVAQLFERSPMVAANAVSRAATMGLADERYLLISEPTALTHQEHAAIPLPAGVYRVTIQREYAPEGIRRVAD